MRAEIVIGVRRNGRVSGEGVLRPFHELHRELIDVPPDFRERELAVAVSTEAITNGRKLLGHPQGLDTVEFTVNFKEEDE